MYKVPARPPPGVSLADGATDRLKQAVISDIQADVPLFAVVHLGGKQYKVVAGDVLTVDQLKCPAGTNIRLEKVQSWLGELYWALYYDEDKLEQLV